MSSCPVQGVTWDGSEPAFPDQRSFQTRLSAVQFVTSRGRQPLRWPAVPPATLACVTPSPGLWLTSNDQTVPQGRDITLWWMT